MAQQEGPSVVPNSAETFEAHFSVLKDLGRGRFGEVQLVEEKGSSSSSSSSSGGDNGAGGASGDASSSSSNGDASGGGGDGGSSSSSGGGGGGRPRRYAIKRTAFGSSGQPDRVKVEVEAQALARLEHENVVRHFGAWPEEKHFCILMEWAPHGDLASLLVQRWAEARCW